MAIPLVDLKKQYQNIEDEINVAINQVLQDTNFILGTQVEKFEDEIARYHNTRFAAGVASGTDALVLSLTACGIGKDDEVITTPFTFIATSEAISRVGAKPVFCDIEEKTYTIDPARLREKITPSTRAIVVVHLYGLPCDMDSVSSLARECNLKVVEDCAQAFGAEYKGKKVGSIGDAGCLSFFPGKNLGAYGDGGMVITNDEDIADKVRMLRNHGSDTKYYYGAHGFNSRLDTLQAAILQVKMKHIDTWIRMRQENAALYNDMLSDADVIVPCTHDYGMHSFNYYTIRVKEKRDALQQRLKESGIASAVYYPLCLHFQSVYKSLGHKPGDFPVAERVQNEVLSLPMYPELTEPEIKEICQEIKIHPLKGFCRRIE